MRKAEDREPEETGAGSGTHGENQNSGTDETVHLSRQDYEQLLNQIKELEAMKERLVRSAADYENAKKRLVREREEFVKFSQESILRSLLPVLDNLERAFSHAGTDTSPAFKNLATGIQMVLKQFAEILKSQGLVRIETVGKQFDAHVHESVGYVKEKGRDHEILDEIEAGYFLGEKLLRAAKVRVRVNEDPGESPQDSAPSES